MPCAVQVKGPGLWRLLRYNRPEWHWILFGVVGSAIVGMIMPTFALSIGNVIAVLFVKDFSEMDQQVRDHSFACRLLHERYPMIATTALREQLSPSY